MVIKGLNKITQNETQDLQLVDNFCKSWDLGKNSHSGAGEGTRTLTPKAPEPKSGASTNFATPAY